MKKERMIKDISVMTGVSERYVMDMLLNSFIIEHQMDKKATSLPFSVKWERADEPQEKDILFKCIMQDDNGSYMYLVAPNWEYKTVRMVIEVPSEGFYELKKYTDAEDAIRDIFAYQNIYDIKKILFCADEVHEILVSLSQNDLNTLHGALYMVRHQETEYLQLDSSRYHSSIYASKNEIYSNGFYSLAEIENIDVFTGKITKGMARIEAGKISYFKHWTFKEDNGCLKSYLLFELHIDFINKVKHEASKQNNEINTAVEVSIQNLDSISSATTLKEMIRADIEKLKCFQDKRHRGVRIDLFLDWLYGGKKDQI